LIPPLTIQPLAGNALRHGLGQKEEGGTLKIKSRREGNKHIVEVIDNGVGFDPSQVAEDPGNHVGLSNARLRIEELCDADMEIYSTIGVGTTIRIVIPERDYFEGVEVDDAEVVDADAIDAAAHIAEADATEADAKTSEEELRA